MIKSKTELISLVREAFKNVTLEDGIGLSEANAIDDYRDAAFRSECRKKDEQQNWTSIPSSELNLYNCSLSFFDAKGMRFYLPAFITAELKGEYNFGLTFTLTHLSDYTKKQFELLSPQQRKAVCSFLEYLETDPDHEYESAGIKTAIADYWSV
jgi:hypothetical protein